LEPKWGVVYDVEEVDLDLYKFEPDWVSPFTDTLKDLMEENNMTMDQLAEALGYSISLTELILKNQVPMGVPLVIKLTKIFGSSVEFWLKRGQGVIEW
jgi:transcriptional regulator with XRE-family HTH domain